MEIHIGNRVADVTLVSKEDNKVRLNVDGRIYDVDIVVVLEAMKMQSNYKVNSDCVVREILVAEGDSVSSNQILMTLDIINEE